MVLSEGPGPRPSTHLEVVRFRDESPSLEGDVEEHIGILVKKEARSSSL